VAASVELQSPARETHTCTCLLKEISDNLVGYRRKSAKTSACSSCMSERFVGDGRFWALGRILCTEGQLTSVGVQLGRLH